MAVWAQEPKILESVVVVVPVDVIDFKGNRLTLPISKVAHCTDALKETLADESLYKRTGARSAADQHLLEGNTWHRPAAIPRLTRQFGWVEA